MYDAPPLPDHHDALDGPPPDTSVKVAHLVFALLFLGAAGAWALVAGEVVTAERLPVLLPALLVAAGVVGLVATVASSRNRRPKPPRSATSHDPGDPGPLGDPGVDDGSEPTQVLR